MRRGLLSTMSGMLIFALFGGAVNAEAPANDAFSRTWERTDRPVIEGAVARTWMWGPEAFTTALDEPYTESRDAQRTVQYFDKARMEITNPEADQNSIWYVTNGLLVVEMVTGRLQLGDNTFEQRQAAQINVAGDANDATGPTYATFSSLSDAAPLPFNQQIIQRVDRAGNVTQDESLANHNIEIAFIDDVTNHTIAAPFWEFMNSSGTVWQDGGYIEAQLFENAFFATGRPISEPYWANVLVGGTPRDVLMQCFERRCLTYTPGNSAGFVVEAGNVGQHYYAWRYEDDGGSGQAGELECVAMGYPCSLAEASQESIDLTFDYGETMVEMMESGTSMADLLTWILAQPNVAEARGNDWVVRFRVDGGRPAWVYDARTFHETGEPTRSVANRDAAEISSTAAVAPYNVVGKDQDSDGFTDEKPKRALVLAPFAWSFEPWDAADEIAAMLQGTRGYDEAGNVHLFANTSSSDQNVLVSHFSDWDTFDVIYIGSHGGESCDSDGIFGCDSFISTGVRMTRATAANMEAVGGDAVFGGFLETASGYIGLSNDFFTDTYGLGGIENTIIYIDSCRSFERADLWDNAGTLPKILSGFSSLVFGWERSVNSDHAVESARLIIGSAIEDGTPIGRSFSEVYDDIINDGSDDARLHLTAGVAFQGDAPADLRIRETVKILDPLTEEPLEDGMSLPIVGEIGDGMIDRLPVAIEVDGVEADPGDFVVHVRFNGEDLPETFTLADGEQVGGGLGDPVTGPAIYRLTDRQVSLRQDVQPGEQLDVMIWVELPEGGETKQKLGGPPKNPTLLFRSTVTGTAETGFVSESIVTAEIPLAFNADLDGVEGKAYDLIYESYEIEISGVPCSIQTTLHNGTIRLIDIDFPLDPDTGKISSLVPNTVMLQPQPDIFAETTIVCPEGSTTLPGMDIHWYAGFVVLYQFDFDQTEGSYRFPNWEEGTGGVLARTTVNRSQGGDLSGELEIELIAPQSP
jgi:hypothetical protein